ncbi:restriction endonuclease subunit S [Pantoea septica]|uniref:restriction endonuclease subunit S n=1 Tax=Pantoea septica TaxID=472695 RepID=UPI0028D80D7D|nr:restriction endonuclease subunit S [Pantoea septica]
MSAEQLITQHIETWASALQTRSTAGRGNNGKIDLYGIKKLRELILELAVRGKLVPQDPNDEPASELLKRIAAEKAELVKQGKIKKQKPLQEISEDEKPFKLPVGWEWVRLGHICTKLTDGSHNPPKDNGSGYPMLSSQNIQNDKIDIENPSRYVCEDGFTQENNRTSIQKDDVLLTIVGSLGRSAVVTNDTKFVLQRSVAVLTSGLLPSYLSNYFKSVTAQLYFLENGKGTAQKGIYLGQLSQMIIPVPSFIEQERIDSRIKELMDICNQLEQQSLTSLEAHSQLVETLLATLTNSQNAKELAENWARISQHFDTLFTTEASIDALKQTILQLAVMGKLVPQDPNDEPASELLKRIEQEKAQLMKEGKIKKQKPLPPVSDEEKPFGLPEGWEFIRLGDLTSKMGSGSTPRGGQSAYVTEGIPFLRSQNVWNEGLRLDDVVYIDKNTHSKMDGTKVFPGDILLNITGASLGRTLIFPDHIIEANVSQHVTIIRLLLGELAPFVHLAIKSPLIQNLVWRRQVGMAIEGLSKKTLELFEFPVPPLLEQHRIVTKIDELFIICEQLKSRLRSAQQTQLHLADALTDAALS